MPYNAMVGFYLNDLQQLRMLARVPIISAYKIATMITGLVIDFLGTNNFLVTKISLLKLIQLRLHLNSPQLLFTRSLSSCKPIQKHLQSTSSFILVLGKANVKCVNPGCSNWANRTLGTRAVAGQQDSGRHRATFPQGTDTGMKKDTCRPV